MLQKFWQVLKRTFSEYGEDKISRLAAALAYYTVFSLPPLLVITIYIAGVIFDPAEIREQIISTFGTLTGSQETADAVADMIAGIQTGGGGLIATIISIATLLFGATGVFVQLQDALNTIWDVKQAPGQGLMAVIKDRLLAFAMVLGLGLFVIAFVLVSAYLPLLTQVIPDIPGSPFLLTVINLVVPLAIFTLIIALVYKYVPQVEIAWSDIWLGAFVTSLLFVVGQWLLGFYLGTTSYTSSYGAVGALVLLLFWIYASAQILFIGAEFTQVYARAYGSGAQPEEGAVRITRAERAEQGISQEGAEDRREQEAPAQEETRVPPEKRAGFKPGARQGMWARNLPTSALYTAHHTAPPTQPSMLTFSAVLATLAGFLGGLVIRRIAKK